MAKLGIPQARFRFLYGGTSRMQPVLKLKFFLELFLECSTLFGNGFNRSLYLGLKLSPAPAQVVLLIAHSIQRTQSRLPGTLLRLDAQREALDIGPALLFTRARLLKSAPIVVAARFKRCP